MNAESLKAIITLFVTAAFNIANAVGFAMDFGTVYNVSFSAASAVCVCYAWWKNQNVTRAAQLAQEYLDEMKRGPETGDDDA